MTLDFVHHLVETKVTKNVRGDSARADGIGGAIASMSAAGADFLHG